MTRILLAFAAATALAATTAAAGGPAFPKRIDLPDGFQPEGIATAGEQFYVSSIPTGAVYRGSLSSGKGAILVPAQAGRQAIGMDADRGRLFVAGGPTGKASSMTPAPVRRSTRSRSIRTVARSSTTSW